MPANYEMIISQSPPVFSHSPPNGFLHDYKTAGYRFYDPSPHAQHNNINNNNNNNQINQNQSFHHNLNHNNYNNNINTSNGCVPLTTQLRLNQNNNNNNYGQNIVKPINFKMVPQIKPKRPCLRKTTKLNDTNNNNNDCNNNNNNNNNDMDNDSILNNWWIDDFDNSDDDLDDDEDDNIINDDIISNNNNNKVKSMTPINITTSTANLNNSKTKKRVVFADDQGLELEHIRIMSEPSNVPPFWSLKFLAHVTQGLISPVPPEQWTIDFRQPASDYLDFRRRLEENKVSLENVIVRENESIVVGTVKVKNLSFHKEVIVRATWDAWNSQEDIFCNYSQIGGSSGAYVLYDTFSFKITLPPSSRKLEFCVCYRCDNKEYWDNNTNNNYCLTKRASSLHDNHHDVIIKLNDKNGICKMIQQQQQINDKQQQQQQQIHNNLNHIKLQNYKCGSYAQQQAKLQSWSEFASWNHLDNTSPYW